MGRKGFLVTLSDEEKETIRAAADKFGMPMAVFIRYAALQLAGGEDDNRPGSRIRTRRPKNMNPPASGRRHRH